MILQASVHGQVTLRTKIIQVALSLVLIGFTAPANAQPTPLACGPNTVAIESAHPYGLNENAHYAFTAQHGASIKVHYPMIDLEDFYDWINILDGAGNWLSDHTGFAMDFWQGPVTLNGDTFDLNFTSDDSISHWGYKVDQIDVDCSNAIPLEAWSPTQAYTFETPHPYADNQSYKGSLALTGATHVRFHVAQLSPEWGYDWFIIRNVTTGQEVFRSTGELKDYWTIALEGFDFELEFVSDETGTAWGVHVDGYQWANVP